MSSLTGRQLPTEVWVKLSFTHHVLKSDVPKCGSAGNQQKFLDFIDSCNLVQSHFRIAFVLSSKPKHSLILEHDKHTVWCVLIISAYIQEKRQGATPYKHTFFIRGKSNPT